VDNFGVVHRLRDGCSRGAASGQAPVMVVTPLRHRWAGLLDAFAGWPRRVAASLCLALAVLSALTSHPRPSVSQSPVVVSARPLLPGTVLAAADLRSVLWPALTVPAAAVVRLADAIGHTVGAAMTRGEPLTAARLLDTGIAAALEPGQVALTITLAGSNQAAILRPGTVVDLYTTAAEAVLVEGSPLPANGSGHRLATNIRVLAVLPPSDDSGGSSLVIAADRTTAARLADRPAGPILASLVPPS
jgi:pilus assembly protein CpaB